MLLTYAHKKVSLLVDYLLQQRQQVVPQKFPTIIVSTIVYKCCKIFPMQSGSAKASVSFVMLPDVMSILFISPSFIISHKNDIDMQIFI